MTRLPRPRKGKTPIDVTVTNQNGLKRVRLSVGNDGRRINSDLSEQEVTDLMTMLAYHAGVANGTIEGEGEVESESAIPNVQKRDAARRRAATDLQNQLPLLYAALVRKAVLNRFVSAMLSGEYIKAIKFYREATGSTLLLAKEDIERYRRYEVFTTFEELGI